MESEEMLVDVVTDDDTGNTSSQTEETNTESTTSESNKNKNNIDDESADVDVVSDVTDTDFSSDQTKQNSKDSDYCPRDSDTTVTEEYNSYVSSVMADHDYCSVYKEDTSSGQENVPKLIVETQQNEDVFCICRTSNVDEFMIGCDNCDEWYHGRCIHITKQDAKNIKKFFCHICQERNPDLQTKYKKSKEWTETEDDDDMPKGYANTKRSNRRCGECDACLIQRDCGKCDYCKDMRKFGGPNKKRQKCRLRQCLNKSRHLPEEMGGDKYERTRPKPGRPPKDGQMKKHSVKLKHTRHPQGRPQKRKRTPNQKGHTHVRRKNRVSSRESSGFTSTMSEKSSRQTIELPRQCYGPQCQRRARPNSKYCSHECGIQLAVRRIQEILPGRVKEWLETPCIANENAEKKLVKLKKLQEDARARLLELDNESKELDEIVSKAAKLTPVDDEEGDAEQEGDLEITIYCVTCGIDLLPKVALKHMERCYMKNEALTSFGSAFKSLGNLFCDFYNAQQRSYCKRLRILCPEHTKEPKVLPNEVCGCPLSNEDLVETSELCCVLKRNCVRHHSWEKLRRAQIDGQRVQQWLKLEEAIEHERSTRRAISQRGGVLGLLLHRTIVADTGQEVNAS